MVGYSPWGPKESDTTERLHFHFLLYISKYNMEILYSLHFVPEASKAWKLGTWSHLHSD